jgi:hypothetical protein
MADSSQPDSMRLAAPAGTQRPSGDPCPMPNPNPCRSPRKTVSAPASAAKLPTLLSSPATAPSAAAQHPQSPSSCPSASYSRKSKPHSLKKSPQSRSLPVILPQSPEMFLQEVDADSPPSSLIPAAKRLCSAQPQTRQAQQISHASCFHSACASFSQNLNKLPLFAQCMPRENEAFISPTPLRPRCTAFGHQLPTAALAPLLPIPFPRSPSGPRCPP